MRPSKEQVCATIEPPRLWQGDCSARRVPTRCIAWLSSRLRRGHPHWLWLSSIAQLLVLVVWMVLDPHFDAAANRLQLASGLLPEADALPGDESTMPFRVFLLGGFNVLVVLTLALLSATPLVGSRKSRSLRAWLVWLTLLCLWMSLGLNWANVTWWGKQYRMRQQLGGFETVAAELRAQWPRNDGHLASSDPFMAYPVGEPATLVMLTLPKTTRNGTSFSVVDRGENGALRFQLTGREAGDWLEWHPPGKKPTSFVGGLLDPHELEQFWDLGRGWFLVRYCQ